MTPDPLHFVHETLPQRVRFAAGGAAGAVAEEVGRLQASRVMAIASDAARAEPVLAGVTVASAGGHGMMWGPAVARVAADLALTGTSAVVDAAPLGLDRFDEAGRSRLATDPIALPFPQLAPEQPLGTG